MLILQSGYFNSMFRKNWRESQQSEVYIDIIDENIDKEGVLPRFTACYCGNAEKLQVLKWSGYGFFY
jgi:hypothetical protein